MRDSTHLGTNRTGLQMSPVHSKELMETVEADAVRGGFESNTLGEVRRDYIEEADSVGSIPAPATLKGMVKTGAKMLSGNRPQVFIDKLAERLAFERGGTRLYDALLSKFMAHEGSVQGVSLEELRRFRDEEAEHANLVAECIASLGADPTAQTPSADLVGVETMGLLQAISDPRTSLAHSLHVAQSAELVDRAGWEVLIALAENMGQDEMADRFRTALTEEQIHLESVTSWYQNLVLDRSELM